MDSYRAKQIIDAKENINVMYQGSPVWIEDIIDINVAQVREIAGRKARIEVPVNMLEEVKQ